MNHYRECKECKEWHWTDQKCDPEYFVNYEEYMGDDYQSVRANNHENAALKFAQDYNTTNDYCLMNDTIDVKVEKDGVIKYFTVGAEPDVHYSSKEIDSKTLNKEV